MFPELKFPGNFMYGKTIFGLLVPAVVSPVFHVLMYKPCAACEMIRAIAFSSQVAVRQNFVYPPNPPCAQPRGWVVFEV